jgi:hypothetical protein
MQTFQATNDATCGAQNPQFSIDFDKKKLTAQALHCEASHQRLQVWLNHPLIQLNFEQVINEKVIISKRPMEIIVAFTQWQKTLPKPGLSELYQTLLLAYYLSDLSLMGQQLRNLGFGLVADYILEFYDEDIKFESCDQQAWFELFFEAWEWALLHVEKDIRTYCIEACYKAHAQCLLDNNTINQRQYQLLIQLQKETKIRDKKALSYSLWYRGLYTGLTKRTQERDFNLICEHGFVQMKGKSEFVVMA